MLNAPTPEKTRICPNCSDPDLGVKDKFCSSCGSAVPMVEEQEEEETSVQESPQKETDQVVEDEEKEEVVRIQNKDGNIEKCVRVIRIISKNMGRVMGEGGENINE